MSELLALLPDWVAPVAALLVALSTAVGAFLTWLAPRTTTTLDDRVLRVLGWLAANVFKYVPRLTAGDATKAVVRVDHSKK